MKAEASNEWKDDWEKEEKSLITNIFRLDTAHKNSAIRTKDIHFQNKEIHFHCCLEDAAFCGSLLNSRL